MTPSGDTGLCFRFATRRQEKDPLISQQVFFLTPGTRFNFGSVDSLARWTDHCRAGSCLADPVEAVRFDPIVRIGQSEDCVQWLSLVSNSLPFYVLLSAKNCV